MDKNDRKNHDRKPDDDADGAKVAGNCCGDGQRHNDFQDAAPERLARVETTEENVSRREQRGHQHERQSHGKRVRRKGAPQPFLRSVILKELGA